MFIILAIEKVVFTFISIVISVTAFRLLLLNLAASLFYLLGKKVVHENTQKPFRLSLEVQPIILALELHVSK